MKLSSFFTALLTIAALFALTGWQVTGDSAAPKLLGRLGASMVELDRWLPAHMEDLDLQARDRIDGVVEIRDLPVPVSLPAGTLIDADPAVLKALMTRQMGTLLYNDGTNAIRDGDGSAASLGITEPVRWTVTFLSPGMHTFWLAVMVLTGLLLLAAAASVMTTGEPPVHAIATGAVIGALLSFGFWAFMLVVSGATSGAVDKEITLILKDGAWTGVRNCGGVAFAAGVIAFLLQMGRGHGAANRYAPAASRPDSPFP